MRCVYAAVYVYGAAWNRMELAHRQTEAHGRCGVMRGLAVAVKLDPSCLHGVEILARVYTRACLYRDDVDVLSPAGTMTWTTDLEYKDVEFVHITDSRFSQVLPCG
jgi:hypothetical protein